MTFPSKAVIFDMDGVILDTEILYTKAEIRLFGEYGVTIPEEDWPLFRGCAEDEFYTLSMNRYNITEDKSIFKNKGRQYVRTEFINNLKFMPGFHELHNKIINAPYKTGLVTASPRHNLNWVRTLVDLDSLFEHIISGEDTERNKPHPEPYLKMMSILNTIPSNTIIIEDSINGIKAGLTAGAYVIAKTGSVPQNELTIAHKIIDHLEEITTDLIEEVLQIEQ